MARATPETVSVMALPLVPVRDELNAHCGVIYPEPHHRDPKVSKCSQACALRLKRPVQMHIEGEEPQSVIAIDKHPIVLQSIHALLAQSPHFRLVGTATDGSDGLQLLRTTRPKLAIIDLNLPTLDGLELARRVRIHGLDLGIVMTSGGSEELDSRLALLAGANAYVGKSESTSLLTAALLLVAHGYVGFHRSSISSVAPAEMDALGHLTKREYRINQLVAEGYRNVEIAKRLGISPKTVSSLKHRISRKVSGPA
ncbi:response regulator [Ralstonia sp. 25C]|uniref:response regulator n=1 Tax=Ralstonia sp. 25C TaxID=3447363 RepID=UPI003F7549DF